jgi:hypothetical protein
MVVVLGGAAFCRTQKDIICSSIEWCGRFAAREFCAIVLQRVDVSRHSLRPRAPYKDFVDAGAGHSLQPAWFYSSQI